MSETDNTGRSFYRVKGICKVTISSKLPDFIGVGPGKTGTNTLFQWLREHPSICVPKHVKGTRFFDRFFNRGMEWYTDFFSHCPDGHIVGEISETYFSNPKVPERMYANIPDVKIIVVLRNPVDRTFSEYSQLCKLGLMSGSFEACLKTHDNLISDNFYYDHLNRYLKYFPRENVLVLLFDDLKKDPALFIERIYKFLGVDSTFSPESLPIRLNSYAKARFDLINRIAFRIIWLLRKLNSQKIIAFGKKSKLVNEILFKQHGSSERPVMSFETREYLQDIYQQEIEKLSDLIGKDLSGWQKGVV